MRITDLEEARSNPALNKDAKRGEGINDLIAWAEKGSYFATFTSVPKVGINPQSQYATPIGVYCYPLGDGQIQDQIRDDELPFAGQQPWINILQLVAPEERTVYVNDGGEDSSRFQELNDHVANWLAQRMPLYRDLSGGGEPPIMTNMEMKKSIIWRVIFKYAADHARHKTPAGIWWNFSRLAALLVRYTVSDSEGSSKKFKQGDLPSICYTVFNIADEIENVPALWTRLMLDIGVDAVIDYGSGVIHGNEPTQAVFFATKVFRVVDRIHNPRQQMRKAIDISREQDFADLLRFTGKKTEPNNLLGLLSAVINDAGYDNQWLTLHPYTRKPMVSKVVFFPWKGMKVDRLVKMAGVFVAKMASDAEKTKYLAEAVSALSGARASRNDAVMKPWVNFMLCFASKDAVAEACSPIFARYSPNGPVHDEQTQERFDQFKQAFGLA